MFSRNLRFSLEQAQKFEIKAVAADHNDWKLQSKILMVIDTVKSDRNGKEQRFPLSNLV
jgi:hypothetical protein